MAKRRSVEPPNGTRDGGTVSTGRTLWLVPRRLLTVLPALIVLPWLITGAAYYARVSDENGEGASPRATTGAAPTAVGDPRPWGQLVVTPIVISPPAELVPTNWGAIEKPEWRFPVTSREELEGFLAWAGLDPMQAAHVASTARHEPRIDGLILTPDPAFVRALHPETRARIYKQLARTPINERHHMAYRFAGTSADAWLGGAPISPRTRQAIEPFLYRIGDFLFFADIDLIRHEIPTAAELQVLARRLFRTSTVLVKLHLDEPAEVEAAAEYWGRGGRRTDIRPLLDSVATSGQDRSIDISHLLPRFAREHLYRYPQVSLGDLEKSSLVNCFWTALNFFNDSPDDRHLDSTFAIDYLQRHYDTVRAPSQLGDIAAFSDGDGKYFHVAVYLADGLVFGKNGTSSLSPWTIVPMDHLKGYYVEYDGEWQVTYYRRRNL